MKRNWILGGAVVAILAGCGLVPPIPVSDPLQLNGKSVTLSLAGGALSSQSAMSGAVNASVGDVLKDVTIPFTPGSFKVCYDFTVEGTFSGPSGSVKLSNIELDLTVNDGTNGPASFQASASEVTMTSAGGKYTGSGKGLCGNASDVAKVIAVLKNAPEPNSVTGTFSLETDATLPPGTTLKITFENGQGEIKL